MQLGHLRMLDLISQQQILRRQHMIEERNCISLLQYEYKEILAIN